MLPYGIFRMTLYWPDGKKLHIRALDLLPKGFRFRTAVSWQTKMQQLPEHCEAHFLNYSERRYETVIFTDFAISETKERESAWICYDFCTENPEFQKHFRKLMRQYTAYIRTKEENDEVGAMEELTDWTLDDRDYEDTLSFLRKELVIGPCEGEVAPVEIGVALDDRMMEQAFLSMQDAEAFLQLYWEINALTGHSVTKVPVTHVYIGNDFCSLRFPNREQLYQLLERCRQWKMQPVIVLAPMSQQRIPWYEEWFDWLSDWIKTTGYGTLEVVVNDLGAALLWQRRSEAVEYPGGKLFELTAGRLLCKRKKDPRMEHCFGKEVLRQGSAATDQDQLFYREYMQERFGIKRCSYEVCGYPIEISGKQDVLYLPRYQTNTAGRCTLYALATTGDRGHQEVVSDCPGYCEKTIIRYPKNSGLIGIGNSVFGESCEELKHADILNGYIQKGIRRLVIRA